MLAVAALPACQRAGADAPAELVLARVNGAEISAQQAPTRQALEKVIDRELLVQKALAAGLDRDPAVRQSVETARRQLLAQAWLERGAATARSTPEEMRAFYAENPALFAERRIYRLRELAVSAPAELTDVLRARGRRGEGPGRRSRLAAAARREVQRRGADPAGRAAAAVLFAAARAHEGGRDRGVRDAHRRRGYAAGARTGGAAFRAAGDAADRAVSGRAQAPGARRRGGEAAARGGKDRVRGRNER